MMVSLALSPKTLALVLAIVSISTISLTSVADAEIEHIVAGQKKVFDMEVGGTEMQPINITNLKEEGDIPFEIYAVGAGSELLLFEENLTVGPKTTKELELFVIIPKDHADNIEYQLELKVLKRAPQAEEGVQMGIRVNIQQTIPVIIKIGDSPIFTPPEVPVIAEVPKEKPIVEKPKAAAPAPVAETIEEKMKRIQEANQANAPEEVIVDDVWQEEFEEEAVVNYEPEPTPDGGAITMNPDLSPTIVEEKIECDFIATFLSWFGIGIC